MEHELTEHKRLNKNSIYFTIPIPQLILDFFLLPLR